MNKEEDFYGDENEDFEELMEKSLLGSKVDGEDDEKNLLSDIETSEEDENLEDDVVIKREERLQSKMNMTRNPLAKVQIKSNNDEQIIKRRIAMLCSALGGFDPNPPQSYILGVEAIGCLKDIKNMLNKIDHEKNVLLVASACHDSGLFVGDLVPIMVHYGVTDVENAEPETVRLLLASLELMVRLLQPVDESNDELDDKLILKLKRAHIEYKHELLHYKKGKIFKYIMALMVPILKKEKKDINKRDNTILNLCLTLCINVMRIQASDVKEARKNRVRTVHVFEELPAGVSEEDISIDRVLEIFKKYNVLAVIQTVTSNLSTDFETKVLSSTCLDFFFYTFFYLDPACTADKMVEKSSVRDSLAKQLNLSDIQSQSQGSDSYITSTNSTLKLLQLQERSNLRKFKKNSSTRHAHFGSLINVQDNKHGNRVLSGQDKLRSDNFIGLLDSNASKVAGGVIINRHRAEALGPHHKFVKVLSKTVPLLDRFVNDFVKNGFGILCSEIYNNYLKSSDISNDKLNFRYFFIIDWVMKFEKAFQSANKKGVRNIERYNYLLYCFSNEFIKTLMNIFIPTFLKNKSYDCLNIGVSVFIEIMRASLTMHSYKNFKGEFLLKEDQQILNKLQGISEATLRTIFEIRAEIEELTKLPQDAHRRTFTVSMTMIEFTYTLMKTMNYITNLKVPIYITGKKEADFTDDEDEVERGRGEKFRKLQRAKQLDKNLCEFYEKKIFNDKTVSTHIWLMNQFRDVEESKLRYCLYYFGKLLKNWKENIFKLVRLDFMYTLYEMKQSDMSDKMKVEFGEMMSAFMHYFTRMCYNSKLFLLEPMMKTELVDPELREYFLTGDPFSSSSHTQLERRKLNKSMLHEDITFNDEKMSDNQKIAYLVTQLYYNDKTATIETLCGYLNQWYHELNNSLTESIVVVGKMGTFRLDGNCLKETRVNPYLRYLCKVGNIINGVLVIREKDKIKQFKEQIEVALNTPLDDHELENVFNDPNKLNAVKLQLLKRRPRDSSRNLSEEEDDAYGDSENDNNYHGYGSEGIDDNDDLAGSESEEQIDELEMMEAKLSSLSNRVKGKAMKRNSDGTLSEMGKKAKRKAKEKKVKKGSSKLRKRRKIVQDDDVEMLSDTELLRRSRLSKETIDDSDDDLDDEEFYKRDMKLHQLLQKRHGIITKDQYQALLNGSLDLEEVSDLDDHLVGEQHVELPQVAKHLPDRETLTNILNPAGQTLDSASDSDDDSNKNSDNESDSDSEADDLTDGNDDNNTDVDDALDAKPVEDAILEANLSGKESESVQSNDRTSQILTPQLDDLEKVTSFGAGATSGTASSNEGSTSEQDTTPIPEEDIFSKLKQLHAILADDN